jgi:hypothetical protein
LGPPLLREGARALLGVLDATSSDTGPPPGAADMFTAAERIGLDQVAAVPTKLVEDVALIGPWAKIADEIQRWKQTVLTTFSLNCDPAHLEKLAALVR